MRALHHESERLRVNSKVGPSRTFRPGTVIRVTAITAFLAAATVVPAGIASAASGSTAPSNVAAPCLPVAADDTYSTRQDVTLTVGAPGVIENAVPATTVPAIGILPATR